MERFIESNEIPNSLWDKSKKKLFLPNELINCWISILDGRNLLVNARSNTKEGLIGGYDEEATNEHYSYRFNGSCARFQLAFLDPKEDLELISNAFTISTAGNKIFIVDMPSGTGAASLSLLCNIAQLRQENALPKQPLKVTILAGEISEYAIAIFQESLDKVQNYLKTNEITVELETILWDVLDKDSTSQLIKEITLKGQYSKTKLLLLANFTGFLETDKNWKNVIPQFEELFRHFSGPLTTAIWLEPQTRAASRFFKKIISWFPESLQKLLASKENIVIGESNARFHHGLKDSSPRTNVSVIKFNTERL